VAVGRSNGCRVAARRSDLLLAVVRPAAGRRTVAVQGAARRAVVRGTALPCQAVGHRADQRVGRPGGGRRTVDCHGLDRRTTVGLALGRRTSAHAATGRRRVGRHNAGRHKADPTAGGHSIVDRTTACPAGSSGGPCRCRHPQSSMPRDGLARRSALRRTWLDPVAIDRQMDRRHQAAHVGWALRAAPPHAGPSASS